MLVLSGIHVVAQLDCRGPQRRFKSQRGTKGENGSGRSGLFVCLATKRDLATKKVLPPLPLPGRRRREAVSPTRTLELHPAENADAGLFWTWPSVGQVFNLPL